MTHRRIVVLGAGQAGASLAAKLRAEGHDGPLALVGEEPALPYQRPPLSKKYLLGEMPKARLQLRPESFWAERDVEMRTGVRAEAIDLEARTVTLAGGEALAWDGLALTLGARPRRLPEAIGGALPGVHHVRDLADVDGMAPAFEPEARLLVVGGGYIGLELGSVWLRLGAKVTVVEMLDEILPNTDQELAVALRKSLEKQGMEILTGTKVTGFDKQKSGLSVKVEGERDEPIACDRVLVAVGRKPCVEGLNLDEAGIDRNKQGQIEVDENYATSKAGVYAIGDLIHGPMLAHKAMDEGVVFVERLAGRESLVDYGLIPGVIYTMPEVASVGATEEELKENDIDYETGKFPFMANGRAKCMDETEGMVKILADPASGHLLGVHILGPKASELIAEAAAVMAFGGSIEDVELIMHPHPTLNEAFKEAALATMGRALHA